ncbi:hypothetical protein D3C87_1611640 [compost metagenome]
MEQRHRDAQPVGCSEPHALAQEKTIVQNAAMRQHRAFGCTGCAAGELDIDRVGVFQRRCDLPYALIAMLTQEHQVAKTHETRHVLFAQLNHCLQRWQPGCLQISRRCRVNLRRNASDQLQVVGGLERR